MNSPALERTLPRLRAPFERRHKLWTFLGTNLTLTTLFFVTLMRHPLFSATNSLGTVETTLTRLASSFKRILKINPEDPQDSQSRDENPGQKSPVSASPLNGIIEHRKRRRRLESDEDDRSVISRSRSRSSSSDSSVNSCDRCYSSPYEDSDDGGKAASEIECASGFRF